MCGGNYVDFVLYSHQLDDLCCKCDPLGLLCLCFYLLLLPVLPQSLSLGFTSLAYVGLWTSTAWDLVYYS